MTVAILIGDFTFGKWEITPHHIMTFDDNIHDGGCFRPSSNSLELLIKDVRFGISW